MLFFRTLARFSVIGIALGYVLVALPVGASPSPTLRPTPAPSSGACIEPDDLGAEDAFAHEIDDARTLAFMSFVENIAPKDRGTVDKRANAPVAKETTEAFGAALANPCDATEVDYRTIRLVYMLATRWSVDEALDDQSAAHNAVAALYSGDRLPPSTRDAALAIFRTSIDQLDAMLTQATSLPSPEPSTAHGVSACDLPITAKATLAVSPKYPPDAGALGVTGTVQVAVALDEHGYVRDATLYKGTFQPDGASGTDLITAALSAAGSSNYEPEFVRCKPIAGKYLFRATFMKGR